MSTPGHAKQPDPDYRRRQLQLVDEVRQHLTLLHQSGMTDLQIARRSGVSYVSVHALGNPARTSVWDSTAALLLAVQPTPAQPAADTTPKHEEPPVTAKARRAPWSAGRYEQWYVHLAVIGAAKRCDLSLRERQEVVRILAGRGWADWRIAKWLDWGDPDGSAVTKFRERHHIGSRWHPDVVQSLARYLQPAA